MHFSSSRKTSFQSCRYNFETTVTIMASFDGPSNGAAAQPQADQTWQLDHPYCVPTPKEISEAKWEGLCHCGQIRFFLSREEPLNSKYCHCSDCQTMHAVSRRLLFFDNPHLLSTHGSLTPALGPLSMGRNCTQI